MRIRHKPHARPTLESCDFFISQPQALRGRWQGRFSKEQPLHIELGCGKGEFIAAISAAHPEINYIAVDIKDEVLLLAKSAAEAAHKADGGGAPGNLLLTAFDIERIYEIISPQDIVDRIYINFPNPWPKPRHHKHRLVHPRQLARYLTFLSSGGEVFFRTDDTALFEDGISALREAGFSYTFLTKDLLRSRMSNCPASEHQRMFTARGLPICMCIAKRSG